MGGGRACVCKIGKGVCERVSEGYKWWIQSWVEGAHEVEQKQHQEEVECVVVEDGKSRGLRICHFVPFPRYPEMKRRRCGCMSD